MRTGKGFGCLATRSLGACRRPLGFAKRKISQSSPHLQLHRSRSTHKSTRKGLPWVKRKLSTSPLGFPSGDGDIASSLAPFFKLGQSSKSMVHLIEQRKVQAGSKRLPRVYYSGSTGCTCQPLVMGKLLQPARLVHEPREDMRMV